jgi:pimeloyl-ACP methyl ester carboxylesterase
MPGVIHLICFPRGIRRIGFVTDKGYCFPMLLRCAIAGLVALGLPAAEGRFWVKTAQGRLKVETAGQGGPPLLLVHGNGGSRRQWSAQLAHFSKTRRVVAFDLRGMGESEPPKNGDYSVAAMAEDVHAVVEELKLERFVLVGHSYGGAVAGGYAGTHPDRVAALILDDVAGDMRSVPHEQAEATLKALAPENFKSTTRAWFEQILRNAQPATRKAVLADLERVSQPVFTGAYQGLLGYDPDAALARYPGPKLHLYTDLLANNPLAVHAGIKGIVAVHQPGTSHWPHMDQPETFKQLLGDFMDSTGPSAPGTDPGERQFDFWLGSWEIFSPKGDRIGENRIAREIGGRVLVERYRGRKGYQGSSFNTYDTATRSWRQTWVDSGGLTLQLSGGVVAGKMVLTGSRGPEGAIVHDRISWEPRKDGTIRQLWESSWDGGKTWAVTFDGIYRKKPEGP